MATIADILKNRDCSIQVGQHRLLWNEDGLLGCWEIYTYKPKPENREVFVGEYVYEDEAVEAFLRLTHGEE